MNKMPSAARLTYGLIVSVVLMAADPAAAAPWIVPPAAPPPAQLSIPASPTCPWTYYPVSGGHLQPEQSLFNDPDNTPIANLSTGTPFLGAGHFLANAGWADFDANGRADVFRTRPFGSQAVWQFSAGGAGAWQDLSTQGADLSTSQMLFGDFDINHVTDVFGNNYFSGQDHWQYSPGGAAAYNTLRTTSDRPDRLALGDFNGDGRTDVFTATYGNNTEQWGYFSGGLGLAIALAHAATNPDLLRFGDFDNNGKTDVFAATQLGDGSTQWQYSPGGALSFVQVATSTVPYADLLFGDFNGDGATDVLTPLPQPDGGVEAVYWPGGRGPSIDLGPIPAPEPALRVGDFNGDNNSDLLALRCGMSAALTFGPRQILAASNYQGFYTPLFGDANGDGRGDLILISACQNPNQFALCDSNHLQLGSALGTANHGLSLVAPQQLGPSNVEFNYYHPLAGDFDGDGKTDVALINLSNPMTVTVAHSNGDGSFSLGSPQIFTGNFNPYNPIVGDFNGDGKDDLAFTTVAAAGGGTAGDNNLVYIATSNGAIFSLGAQQSLPPASGWAQYRTLAGDFNGDGKTDLVFDSPCRRSSLISPTCDLGDANLVYTALSDASAHLTLNGPQNYGSGWVDYVADNTKVGDVNGDGRADLVWVSYAHAATHNPPPNPQVRVGFANPDGSFAIAPAQSFGSADLGALSLADLNRDGRADLIWNIAPDGQRQDDVDVFTIGLSNGDGTFHAQGPGQVYTGPGAFHSPVTAMGRKLPTSLMLVSQIQDPNLSGPLVLDRLSISNALITLSGTTVNAAYLPFVRK